MPPHKAYIASAEGMHNMGWKGLKDKPQVAKYYCEIITQIASPIQNIGPRAWC